MFAALNPGDEVIYEDRHYRLGRGIDFSHVLGHDLQSRAIKQVPIRDLKPLQLLPFPRSSAVQEPVPGVELGEISAHDWDVARARHAAIKPLLKRGRGSTRAINGQAVKTGVHRSTIYRWLCAFREGQAVEALRKDKPGPAGRQGRVRPEVETIISGAIDDHYLRREKPSVEYAAREAIARCRNAGFKPPHPTMVRRRVKWIDEESKDRRRSGEEAARRYAPILGELPNADRPLAVIQIDHTKVDLILVDDIHRRPVGQPWITLAMDVFSRMVAGFYVSFDPPGALAVGLCFAHAILPKELLLAKYDLKTPWPVWGLMDAVHCDHGKEFRGEMLNRACENYGIDVLFRRVRKPWYGGHIERLLGTVLHEIHTLPGTTFSRPAEKGSYDSEGKTILTLAEFEKWLATFLVEVYHQRVHSALGVPPLKKYEQGIFDKGTQTGRGLPERCMNEAKLWLDFMPFLERTVQRSGLMIDEIHYYSDVLWPWILAKDPEDPRQQRKFAIRRDPRDISVGYFYDPQLQQHFEIPYRNRSRPPISVWELREARRRIRQEGRQAVDEDLIFDAYDRMRQIEQEAARQTKTARREEQRRRLHGSIEKPTLPAPESGRQDSESLKPVEEITPFDEIED